MLIDFKWSVNDRPYNLRMSDKVNEYNDSVAFDLTGLDGMKAYSQITREAAEQIINHLTTVFDLGEISDDDGLYITDEGQRALDEYVASQRAPVIVVNNFFGVDA